jgi:PTS system nitrogen regulatory IIA component
MELLVKDVVRLFNIPEDTVYHWVEQRKLPACNIGGQYHFNKMALFEWATQSGVAITKEFLEILSDKSLPLPGVAQALEQGGIHYGLKGNDKPAVLKSMVQILPLPDQTDREFLLKVLLGREELGSTGIGDGIAIPHPRNPIVLNVENPILALFFLERQVDFDSIDKMPVNILFALISPTTRVHLHLLSRIAYLLHNQAFKALLRNQAEAGKILAEAGRIEQQLRIKS